jgi:Ca-activated chloride channel family protein
VYEQQSRKRNPLPLVVAVVVGAAAIVGTYLVLKPDSGGKDNGAASAVARSGCVEIVMSASSEKAALLTELAGQYARSGRTFGQKKCADVKVYSKASGGSAEALGRGWDAARDGAPAPDVWSPASSSWARLLQETVATKDQQSLVPDGKIPSIAQTPLVIAMPKPMATALGWPRKPLGWGDVLGLTTDGKGWGAAGHPEWGAFKLGKTNPNFSTSGLNATVGTYFAATGRSSDLTAADLSDGKVTGYVKSVESGVVHYGDTTLTFMSNLATAAGKGRGLSYISAVAVEEKSVYDYNTGNPTGDPKRVGQGTKPQTPLVAIYPKEGTLLSDNPYVVLRTVSDDKRAAADDFRKYLQEPAQQKRFQSYAFRSFDGKAGKAISEANGMLPAAKYSVIDPPAPTVLRQILTSWSGLRKRAQVLLVLDVSGSMSDSAGSGSKLDLAKRAAQSALTQFGPDDEVGLWTFSTGPTLQDTPYQEKVKVGPLRENGGALKSAIAGLAPKGGTALYATTRAAYDHMLAKADPAKINAVVLLTDGKNEFPPDNDLDGLTRKLSAAEELQVRVFPIGYGDRADLGALGKIAAAAEGKAYDASDPASIDNVLTAVVSNF